ncbi:Na+/H+ antiporter NhaC family protein [Peptoniphilus catoniae]|uniref:Na+/H+ antiporter NhaC family protein n=1 Tax=Peptoniphilus catoniae TaxID=1660341 RepID=UPI0010FF26F6|nr:Na+/H+ antiporter NhaC family protein [Peptoniphilus catoniae]
MENLNMGIISLVPAIIAIILSFAVRDTVFALAIACIVGTLLAGQGPMGFPTLLKESLGTTSFSWVMLLNTLVAILVAFFRKTGAIQGFTKLLENKNFGRRGVQILAWILGIFVYFSDSFSPLFVGTVMRPISDKVKISREKLSYIADSGAAPVSVLVPITGWAAYLSGLAIGIGPIADESHATKLFLHAIPYNIYSWFTVLFVGLIAAGIIKDFGPMKKAEERAMKEGKLLRDGANPLMSTELTDLKAYSGIKPRVFLNFILPVLLIVTIAISTYITMKSAKTMEAFLFVSIFMVVSMLIQGIPLKEIMSSVGDGIKGATPAVTILALAYSVNSLSKVMGTADYIISIAEGFLSPHLLPAIIFIIAAIISFSTGSSWGTFAICMPIALPLAYSYTGGELTPLIYACFGAVAGGGVFGDHCSPLSDTTILASTGSAADHIDHVKTQLPYAFVCGAIAVIGYLVLGFI